jgi:hypothetical protein
LEAHSHVTQHQESQHAVIQQQRVRVTRPAWLCLSEWKRLKLTTEVTDELSDTLRILSDKNPDFAALSKAVRDSVAIMDQCLWGLRKVLEQRDFSANNHDLWSTMLACTRTEDRKIKKKLMEDASEALVMLSAHQTRGPSGFNNAFCVVQTYVHQANQVVEHNDKLYAAIKSNTHARAGRHDAKVRAGEA